MLSQGRASHATISWEIYWIRVKGGGVAEPWGIVPQIIVGRCKKVAGSTD